MWCAGVCSRSICPDGLKISNRRKGKDVCMKHVISQDRYRCTWCSIPFFVCHFCDNRSGFVVVSTRLVWSLYTCQLLLLILLLLSPYTENRRKAWMTKSQSKFQSIIYSLWKAGASVIVEIFVKHFRSLEIGRVLCSWKCLASVSYPGNRVKLPFFFFTPALWAGVC